MGERGDRLEVLLLLLVGNILGPKIQCGSPNTVNITVTRSMRTMSATLICLGDEASACATA